MSETVKLGLKSPNFYRTHGNYERLQKFIDNGTVKPNDYVYDSSTKKLLHVNDDKTYDYIGGDVLKGTVETPIQIETLTDGMYVLYGNYSIKNTDVDHFAKSPVMVYVEVDAEHPTTVHATIYTSNGCTIYTIESDKTTIDELVTKRTVMGIVEEQVPQIIEDVTPSIIEDNVEPVPDEVVDDYMDDLLNRLFPEVPQGGGD